MYYVIFTNENDGVAFHAGFDSFADAKAEREDLKARGIANGIWKLKDGKQATIDKKWKELKGK